MFFISFFPLAPLLFLYSSFLSSIPSVQMISFRCIVLSCLLFLPILSYICSLFFSLWCWMHSDSSLFLLTIKMELSIIYQRRCQGVTFKHIHYCLIQLIWIDTKGYSILHRASKLESHYQMQFSVIPKTTFFLQEGGWRYLTLCCEYSWHFLSPVNMASSKMGTTVLVDQWIKK